MPGSSGLSFFFFAMSDTPNSPNELFKKVANDTAYQVIVDTQRDLCEEMLKDLHSVPLDDDATVGVNVGRMKELLASCMFHCETIQKVIDVCKSRREARDQK